MTLRSVATVATFPSNDCFAVRSGDCFEPHRTSWRCARRASVSTRAHHDRPRRGRLPGGQREGPPGEAVGGEVLSDLAREALTRRHPAAGGVAEPEAFYGFEPLPPRGGRLERPHRPAARRLQVPSDAGAPRRQRPPSALLDADHFDHQRAREWLAAEIEHGSASCAVTHNGSAALSASRRRYPSPVSPSEAVDRLRRATAPTEHHVPPCAISLLDDRRVHASHVHGPRQVTDAYLLALAVEHGGRFVTFDRSIPLSAAPGSSRPEHLVVL